MMGELRELHLHADRSPSQEARAYQLIDSICELVAGETSTSPNADLLAEAKLAALDIGVELQPDAYRAVRNDCRKTVEAARTLEQLEAASARRTRGELESENDPDALGDLVTLHAATYPHCERNVELILENVKQLVETRQVSRAVSVTRQGLRLCADHIDIHQLNDRLQRMYLDNPGAIGTPMNFVGPDLDGRRVELEAFLGRPILVLFWTTACPTCRQESLAINDIAAKYRDSGLQVVGVSLDGDRDDLLGFLSDHEINWPQIHTSSPSQLGLENPIAKHFQVTEVPRVFLVDKHGDIAESKLHGGTEIRQAVVDLLTDTATDDFAAK
jgi:peroxiredoxin